MAVTRILAIDPGPTQSAWVLLVDGRPAAWAKAPNAEVLERLAFPEQLVWPDVVAIEQIEPRYGLTPGWETLDTARWAGRFQQAAGPVTVALLKRSDVLRHLGVVTRGPGRTTADAGVRAALIDRYGGPFGKAAAIGRKAEPGPLYGLTADCWAALAVAVTYHDQQLQEGTR